MTNKKMTIAGNNVQDVVYRLFLLDNAERMLITHLDARNLKKEKCLDQEVCEKVEILIGGDEHRINKFVDFVKNNFPENANVDIPVGDAENYDGDIRTIESFSRCLSVHQLVKFANIGTKIVIGQDKFRTETTENFGKMDKKFGLFEKKMDVMIGKQEEMIGEIKGLRNDFQSYFDQRFEKLEKDVFLIKEKMHIVA